MKLLGTYETYVEYGGQASKEEFDKNIFDVSLAIVDYTLSRVLTYNLTDYEKKMVNLAIRYGIDWWIRHREMLEDFGTFTSYGFGDFSVEVPRKYEDDPSSYWDAMRLPEIAKNYLRMTRLCNHGI